MKTKNICQNIAHISQNSDVIEKLIKILKKKGDVLSLFPNSVDESVEPKNTQWRVKNDVLTIKFLTLNSPPSKWYNELQENGCVVSAVYFIPKTRIGGTRVDDTETAIYMPYKRNSDKKWNKFFYAKYSDQSKKVIGKEKALKIGLGVFGGLALMGVATAIGIHFSRSEKKE